ncbi:amino acid adenylation domain-containing protein [Saccharothrix ecbatanensis]|uniref:Amino acid adenylation domain-containing protein n=1 Tax=Saccharothrix ecbatanensis TaxID=1105145 RepID=A0A7W9HJG4_9PSEU|nr:amino acid adenylation domain-containing protein [Saccharothrix ecbatanensis]MBB5802959.1 amino acid adenylation domain-containing protein [Saccharothrix ecbatanensis]
MTSTDVTTEMFPLSPQQRYAWLTRDVSTGAGEGCPAISGEITIRGPLDVGRLRAALDGLVERYEILRTDYLRVAGLDVPLQRINAAAPVAVDDITESGWRSRAAELMDPAGPPLHVGLARRDDQLHTLFLRLPAMNADAESVALLVENLAGLYGGTAQASTDEEPLQYADLAEWFNQQVSDADDESRRHWQSLAEISGDLPRLPFQYSRADRASRAAAEDTVEVPLPDGLREMAERDGGTVRQVLLASWAALLGRYTPGRPLVVMASRSGRQEADLADAIGPLAKLVPVRLDDDPSASLRSLIRHVMAQDEAAEVLHYAIAPEAWLTDDSAEQARTSIGFTHRVRPRAVRAGGAEFELDRIGAVLETDIELAVEQDDASVRVMLRYRTDSFDRADVADLAAALGSVLETWLSAPETPVDEVPLLPADRHRTAPVVGEPVPVHERFARHALAEPSAIAVVDNRGRHSYGALHATAQALADRLGERGAGPGSLVGVLFGRGAGALAAMLAVLESGAAYVPLDPTLPVERLRLMVEDSGAQIIITEPAYAPMAESLRAAPIVVDDLSRDGGPVQVRDVPAVAADLAYVLYTSGTAGRPKGVLVGHRHIAAYVDAITERLDLVPGLGYAHVSTLSADLGYTVLYAALCTGGTLHLVDDDVLRNGDELADHLQREAVDVVKITPSHLTALLQTTGDPAGLIPARALVIGGELLRRDLAARLDELADGCEIVNHYGPTEATVGTTAYRVRQGDLDPRSESVPIGGPLGAATVQVVDKALHEVPRWVPGELVIGGPGVADGYLGLPELTAERFIPDPLSPRPDGRRYRTGDLVRMLPSGDLEFLGRDDDQVKIAGYRVELREIESTLRTHPDVKDAAALVNPDDAGQQRLVAFVVGAGDLPETELHQFAAARLPHYMRPAAIVTLDAFPLSANGKLDRAALVEAAADVRQTGHRGETPPRDTTELLLSHLWTRSLGRTVGVTEDFFEVGGNSLKAIRLIADIRKATGISLPVSAMVNASSIEAMAQLLRTEEREDRFRSAVPLQASGSLDPFFCVHAGGGGVLGYLPLARAAGDERPFIGLQSPGLYPGGSSPAELTAMAARYVEEIKAHQAQGPYWLGGWCLGGIIAHEVARQMVDAGDEVARLVLFDSDAPVEAQLDGSAGAESSDGDVTDIELVQNFAWHYQLDIPTSELESLDDQARLDYLVRLVRSKDLLPADAGRAELRQMLTVYRGNVNAARRYIRDARPPLTPSVDYPVTLFLAVDEPVRDDVGETLGWAQIYGSGVRVERVPGDHHTMMVPPQVDVLAQRLAALLAGAGSTGGAAR